MYRYIHILYTAGDTHGQSRRVDVSGDVAEITSKIYHFTSTMYLYAYIIYLYARTAPCCGE